MKYYYLAAALLLVAVSDGADSRPPCSFPAIYNFGDSNSDTGAISAAFQAIPWPFGETFFKKPAGRDSDGRNIIDFLAERLDLPYLSAYLNSIGANFSHGANFATGGSTIRRQNETIFEHSISPFSLDVQIWHYDQFRSRTTDLYKEVKNSFQRSVLPNPEYFNKALYTFDIGQNDLAVAFRNLNNDQIRALLPDMLAQFSSAIQVMNLINLLFPVNCLFVLLTLALIKSKHLYGQGARTFWIHNTGPFGCLPVQTTQLPSHESGNLDEYGCIKNLNEMSMEFNNQLKDAVKKLRTHLPEAAITYVDLYAAKYGLISDSKNQGFEDPMKICCGYHEKDGYAWCGQKGRMNNGTEVYGTACLNPKTVISWDSLHYSEAANHWFADHILNGSLSNPPVPITHACYRA
ncbi:hypothetical protein V2J09_004242 [Rumex salicifolius]